MLRLPCGYVLGAQDVVFEMLDIAIIAWEEDRIAAILVGDHRVWRTLTTLPLGGHELEGYLFYGCEVLDIEEDADHKIVATIIPIERLLRLTVYKRLLIIDLAIGERGSDVETEIPHALMAACRIGHLATEPAITENSRIAIFAEERVPEIDGHLGTIGERATDYDTMVKTCIGLDAKLPNAPIDVLLVEESVVGVVLIALIIHPSERRTAANLDEVAEHLCPIPRQFSNGERPVVEESEPRLRNGAGVVAHEIRPHGEARVALDGGVVLHAHLDAKHPKVEIGVELMEHGSVAIGRDLPRKACAEIDVRILKGVTVSHLRTCGSLALVVEGVASPLVAIREQGAELVVGSDGSPSRRTDGQRISPTLAEGKGGNGYCAQGYGCEYSLGLVAHSISLCYLL